MPIEVTIDDVRSNVARLATALGQRARGEAILARFDERLAAVPHPEPPVRIAFYWENGYTSGSGTLATALVEAAGLRNAVSATGLGGTAPLPIERLLLLDIDLLVQGYRAGPPAQAEEILRHPALKHGFTGVPRVSIPDALWFCGTPPAVLDIVERLSQAGEAVRRDREGGGRHTARSGRNG